MWVTKRLKFDNLCHPIKKLNELNKPDRLQLAASLHR